MLHSIHVTDAVLILVFCTELKLAMLDMYQRVVRERYSRHRLVREHGLINIRRHIVHQKKYHRTLGSSVCSCNSVPL